MSAGRNTRTCVSPPVENPTCADFEVYEDIPKTVPLEFTEDDVMWVASKLSGAAVALGAEAMELRNWLLCFGYASEELRVVVASLADWMAKSSPPWAAYRALMACRLVALDKRPGVRPVGIGEELAIQSARLATMTLGSSYAHPKQRSQFLSYIASAPSAPAAPESFDATHMTSSSVKSRVTVLGTFS